MKIYAEIVNGNILGFHYDIKTNDNCIEISETQFENFKKVLELKNKKQIKKDIKELDVIYLYEKMKQENVYNDYITYMDNKTIYNERLQDKEAQKILAYEQALKENPNLTYEEFMSVQPMTLNLVEEPQTSDALKKFMEKYL